MRKVKIFSALTLAALVLASMTTIAARAQETKPVTSHVTAATIFLQGAELTQTASLSLKKGTNEISIEGLSPDIDRNSVRINIGGGVVVSSFEYSIDYLSTAKAPSARLKMLNDSIAIYQARLDRVAVDAEINAAMKEYLSTGIAKNVSGSETGLGIDELKKTMDYYESKSEEILIGARELAKSRADLLIAISRVQNQYREESGAGGKTSGVLKLNLSAPAAGTFPATVTYFTPAASWSPYYDINATSTDGPVTIAAKSRVSQTTGLDWENVRLTLSTAVPSSGKVAPLFSTWFLRQYQPPNQPPIRVRGTSSVAAQNTYSYQEDFAIEEEAEIDDIVVIGYGRVRKSDITGAIPSPAPAPPTPTIYDHVTTTDNALNVTYNIDLPYSIPGSGKEQNIDLATTQTPAEYKYYCAPRLDGATYLIAEISNWESLGLLSAPANITYDDTYIGETWIDASSTQEKLTLTLGTDKRVSVMRELAREFSSTRAIGSTTEQTFTWRITVRNSQTKPVAMVLKDQYPTSTDRSITVSIDSKATTPWTANKEDVGVVTWEGPLAAGEVRTYIFSYTVKYPKEMNLNL